MLFTNLIHMKDEKVKFSTSNDENLLLLRMEGGLSNITMFLTKEQIIDLALVLMIEIQKIEVEEMKNAKL
jgi:hypothetical protein